jgi:hypothetical protein
MINTFKALCLLLPIFSYAQGKPTKTNKDTIFVSSSKNTYVVFNSEVTFLDLGTKDFVGLMDGKSVILKAVKDSPIPTSVFIKYGPEEKIYHGTIVFMENPATTFVDFRSEDLPTVINSTRGIKPDSMSLDQKIIERRIGILEGSTKEKYKEIGEKHDNIIFSLSDMMRDQDYLYIKILLVNKSKLDYKIDFMDFSYHTPRNNRSFQDKDEIKPTVIKGSNDIKIVKSHSEAYLIYCLPKYVLTQEGFLNSSIREKDGARTFSISIKYKELMSAKTF